MQNTAKNRAYQRGLKAAGIWKGTKNRLKQWDALCVAWATKHHLPKLAGHVPVAAGVVLFASGVLLGGAIISVVLLFVAGLASVICGSTSNKTKEQNHSSDEFIGLPTSEYQTDYEYPESGYRNGHSGYGYYSGDIKMDD
ncbi:hypothetical protein [Pectobacterium carotovorum]|uniref:DUF3742 family protein n=1 Tax=Pectobacterium carotovorum TaxID=554 RepID=A0A419AUD9_PECCA|nr:hypothetical protein [Pectobacterium carotovorum]RJL50219.1 hypothetical protein D5071_14485 [Pectobacterium carotovorum]